MRDTMKNLPSQGQNWGIPYNVGKTLQECESADGVGAFLDGREGTVRRLLESLSSGFWLLSQGPVTRKALLRQGGTQPPIPKTFDVGVRRGLEAYFL